MQQVIYSSLNTANRFLKKKYFIFSRFLKIMFKANTRHHVFFFLPQHLSICTFFKFAFLLHVNKKKENSLDTTVVSRGRYSADLRNK